MAGPVDYFKAVQRLEDLCAKAEHCQWEMLEKMRGWGLSAADRQKALDHLLQARFVDDARFAEAYVRDKLRFSHWGKRKIYMGLYAKHIQRDLAQKALAAIDSEEYYGILIGVLKSKMRAQPQWAATFEGRTKLYRFGISRGFESELVSKALKQCLAEKE